MGINSTFQSFVRSEVKTPKGFRLVEAYLTRKNFTDKQSAEYSDYEIIEEAKNKPRTHGTSFVADPDFTSNTSFEEMPDEWMSKQQAEVTMQLAMVSKTSPQNLKRMQTYQILSQFKPIGQYLDFKL
ncbi:hypothetical protein [Gracilimonas sp. BCB1]|uniref:hypothetical protein n=1 Tax=Gracilimonas sp. BCB1 TaxID=3152362 RepID=UPI0032D9403D